MKLFKPYLTNIHLMELEKDGRLPLLLERRNDGFLTTMVSHKHRIMPTFRMTPSHMLRNKVKCS